jgi:hypothetical protein
MWGNRLFYLGVLELHVFALRFCLWPAAVENVFVGMEVCCMAVGHFGRAAS